MRRCAACAARFTWLRKEFWWRFHLKCASIRQREEPARPQELPKVKCANAHRFFCAVCWGADKDVTAVWQNRDAATVKPSWLLAKMVSVRAMQKDNAFAAAFATGYSGLLIHSAGFQTSVTNSARHCSLILAQANGGGSLLNSRSTAQRRENALFQDNLVSTIKLNSHFAASSVFFIDLAAAQAYASSCDPKTPRNVEQFHQVVRHQMAYFFWRIHRARQHFH